MMRSHGVLSTLWIVGLLGMAAGIAWAASQSATEYEIKAAFILNFAKFVDWPDDEGTKRPVVIGVIGQDPFKQALDALTKKQVKNRELVVKRFDGPADLEQAYPQVEQLRACHVLFVSVSESKSVEQILGWIKDQPILTVSEMPQYLEKGGMINFVTMTDKARFEVNLEPIRRCKLQIRSQLLRLAIRVEGKEQ